MHYVQGAILLATILHSGLWSSSAKAMGEALLAVLLSMAHQGTRGTPSSGSLIFFSPTR